MKILLFGARGQVGIELQRSLQRLGEVIAYDQEEFDLTDLRNLSAEIQTISPSAIVNAAAYTAVDKAESEPELAKTVNADAVEVMANEAKRLNIPLIHYSTDYVFDGTNTKPYVEDDKTNPLSVYGKTKLQGEEAIRFSGCNHLIFRTSWVYSPHGTNFAKTMLRLAAEREELSVVSDQFGVPTNATLLADVATECLEKTFTSPYELSSTSGTYHLTPSGKTNWFEFAKRVITLALEYGEELKVTPGLIKPILTADYHTPAARPTNSLLNTNKLIKTFDVYLPPWEQGVNQFINTLAEEITL